MAVPALVDTNILVYRYDSRFPAKQRTATKLLRSGLESGSLVVPHQAIIEFVVAVSRPISAKKPMLALPDAHREAEELLSQFPVCYPNEMIVRTALRGAAAYMFSWFDAHLWAYAEHFGFSPLYSEDFQHNRLYGRVRVINPFV